MRRVVVLSVVLLTISTMTACGDDGTPVAVPFTIELEPEFVQGAIPGAATGVLVTITNDSPADEPVELTASAVGAQVAVEPTSIAAGEVAEVTVIVDPTAAEQPLDIVVTGQRGELVSTATRSTTVFPWEDDRGPYAATLLGIFAEWLATNEPDLGIDPTTDFVGSYVAPGLLVVSHYCYMSEEWELGLSWHVMVPPDDWAEIYLRPRNGVAPTLAFRLASQSAALDEGVVEIAEVAPPTEVVR